MRPELSMISTKLFKKNILDWSRKYYLTIALNESVYLMKNHSNVKDESQKQSQIIKVFTSPNNIPTCVKCSISGGKIAIGTENGLLKIFDAEKEIELSTLNSHTGRVCCISFNEENILSSGSRDTTIVTHDLRTSGKPAFVFKKHLQEVCSLRWDSFGTNLASGGNENIVYIWDARRNVPVKSFTEHKAAIRALCWSPYQFGVLASGGGNNDKSIKFWNVSTSSEKSTSTFTTDSQVCNIIFSSHSNEMLSTHGFSKNQIMLWNMHKKERFAVIDAHQTRVLHAAYSPDGESIATCSSDETLKFWKVFSRPQISFVPEKNHFLDIGSYNFR